MNRRILIVFGAAIFLCASLVCIKVWSAWSQSRTEKTMAVLRDIPYVPGSTDPFQQLDLYLPEAPTNQSADGKQLPLAASSNPAVDAGKTLDHARKNVAGALYPVIVWIHGGAWMAGDKNHPPAISHLLSRGYAVASINYRLTDRFAHPAQINDCKAALRFLRAHASEYNLDPSRIGVWGHSAGGHLAALVGTSGDVKELEGELGNNNLSSRVQAVVDWSGPTDLLSIASQAKPNSKIDFRSPTNPVAVLMGASSSPTAYLSASPVQYISKDDPPILIIHAVDDDVVPVEQSKEMSVYLKKAGVDHQCRISSTGGHALSDWGFVNESIEFFDKYIGQSSKKNL